MLKAFKRQNTNQFVTKLQAWKFNRVQWNNGGPRYNLDMFKVFLEIANTAMTFKCKN